MREDAFPVFGCEADAMQRYAQFRTTAARVLKIVGSRAVAAIVLPVRHEQALHVVAGLQQQQGGDRRIDTARHRDDVARHGRQSAVEPGEAVRT